MNDSSNAITNQLIYEEILKNRTELKNTIDASETRLLQKIEELNKRLNTLEKENLNLKTKIEILETRDKKNNIIIFGINKPVDTISPQFICQKLNHLLDTDLTELDLNNAHSLGNSENSPIKVEFVRYLTKNTVLQNCHKLKGIDISISHDLTFQQRRENKTLRKHLQLTRQREDVCYIKNNKLYVNGKTYTPQDLEEIYDTENAELNTNNVTENAPENIERNTNNVTTTPNLHELDQSKAVSGTPFAENKEPKTPETEATSKQPKVIPWKKGEAADPFNKIRFFLYRH
ncbi:hypothetical protein NQ314_003876 [Rhamnusium bicolor]|uniref:Uncharacterized protein n=1 Tax=Rhamnusium bicolor TaxID=1586634 RepID=A0AAV8ZMM5_9CUCU|nr:hypothetical protein NQ314_003876 [Rhamnusium bicolor]